MVQATILDASKSCGECGACHSLYLLYVMPPIPNAQDTRATSTTAQYWCSNCWWEHQEGQEDQDHNHEEDKNKKEEHGTKKEEKNKKSRSGALPTTRAPILSVMDKESCNLQACLDLLHQVENEMEVAALSLSEEGIQLLTASIRREVQSLTWTSDDEDKDDPNYEIAVLESIEETVRKETMIHQDLWQSHWDKLEDTAKVLQEAVEAEGDDESDLLLAYYQWRAGHRPLDHDEYPPWKLAADRALDQRDLARDVGPGQFKGASGYCGKHIRDEDALDDKVESIATSRESNYYKVFPVRRGTGWNPLPCKPWDDDSLEATDQTAFLDTEPLPTIVHSEARDRELSKEEHRSQGIRYTLILALPPTSPRKTRATTVRPIAQHKTLAQLEAFSSKTPTPTTTHANENDPQQPEPRGTTRSSPVYQRAKRRCQRQIHKRIATKCDKGAKGGLGPTG